MYTGKLVFAQVMEHMPMKVFRHCVQTYNGNHKVKSFSCLDQYLCMAFAQLTNNFTIPAQTVADLYHYRWQVELFFKWIKQNLKIKSFVSTKKNAVMTQIWIALCMYLLLAILNSQFFPAFYLAHPKILLVCSAALLPIPQSS